MNFQNVILNLQRYWADQGCVIQQPVDQETGAGTLNPATYLRVLGPEPWNVAYVEPCRRPTDGRYGENPYRLGAYYQFQVILKPSPKNVLELYLNSIRALGVDPLEHDIRFVEDDWEQATLGAWGLGWEVWADGMEITQFTYFQQTGQVDLNPICAEITYGLERISMYLQGVDNVFDLEWVDGVKYGDIHTQSEQEYSQYCFEEANTDILLRHLDEYEAEAIRLLDKGLVLPGYDFVLKANHAFNVLDARGAISVTERQKYTGRIRRLARDGAKAHLAKREALGWPMLRDEPLGIQMIEEAPVPTVTEDSEFFLEIGLEELPAAFAEPALAWLAETLGKRLAEEGLSHGAIHTAATPRRLALWVDDLQAGQADEEKTLTGPPARIAFDAEGKPTQAALGFARKQGIDPSTLFKLETDRGEYLAAVVQKRGARTAELLPGLIEDLISNVPFRKSMRWGTQTETFARPVHWICALYGGQVIPARFADVTSGNLTYGHRFHAPEAIVVEDAAQWASALGAASVEVDAEVRRETIRTQLVALAAEAGGVAVEDPELVAEVANLCEQPWGQIGRFDASNLELPREVLVTSMRSHQRYFAVEGPDGALLPCFVVFNNTRVRDPAVVAHGNERVLKARLHDGRFFYAEDRKQTLESRRPMLERVTFLGDLEKVGARTDLLGRVDRIEQVAKAVCWAAYRDQVVATDATRAAKLAKADLATLMVGEFPDLQGTIGADYAVGDGERAQVADAIGEQYRPKGPSDDVPRTPAGICLAVADKLELMAACFCVGRVPSGNKDPFGLRRAALGVLRTLHENDVDVDLRELIGAAVGAVGGDRVNKDEITGQILEFLGGRLRAGLTQEFRTDIVDAVLEAGYDRPGDARARVAALAAIAEDADLAPLGTAFKRINNILTKNADDVDAGAVFAEDRATQTEEKILGNLAAELSTSMQSDLDRGDYRAAMGHLIRLQEPLDAFFNEVMVMHEDAALRSNRLALLAGLRHTFSTVADISRIQVRPAP